jgi:hypothetical protein
LEGGTEETYCRPNYSSPPIPSKYSRLWLSTLGGKFFFWDPIYLQAVIIHSANGGKG